MKAALSYQASMSANDGSYAFANLQTGRLHGAGIRYKPIRTLPNLLLNVVSAVRTSTPFPTIPTTC